MVMMPNENLARAASDPSFASQWVQDNVKKHYPATQIHAVAVGNEVFADPAVDKMNLVPAMTNVQKALARLGLANNVKVSTPVAFSAVTDSYPPSKARFGDDVAQPVMKPMLEFLQRTGSFLTVNIYPCLTQMQQPNKIPLDYALGNAEHAVVDGSNMYHSLLDAQLDATHYAMEKLGFANVEAVLGETGCPNKGHTKNHKPPRGVGSRRLLDDGGPEATVANAQAYNNYVINRVLSGNTGTPHRPDADMDVYIFALFNENGKSDDPDDVERNFGLFYPNMQKIYEFDFRGDGIQPAPAPPTASWCVANAAVGDDRLQQALDYACGHGADCSAIQPSGSCFEPDTKLAHASYAFNSYYQANGRAISACDFNGAASIVYQAPAGEYVLTPK
ncbi:unnamed protein product [Miscanthus lutarioriparius]|uniref:X8 domain-containing protein n=1 Tax=Miscanthus lutarioriparius TaxID=422564 RepID=A0A811N1L6_9POAL|nr:unnamed protein product [Miscanthus lutarioriparius]